MVLNYARDNKKRKNYMYEGWYRNYNKTWQTILWLEQMGSCTHEMTFNTKHAYLEALGDNDSWSSLSVLGGLT